MEPTRSARAAIVLSGGRSTRMGTDKFALPFGDETLLERVVRIVGEAVDEIVVVVREGQDPPPIPATCRIARDPAEGLGPLAGLAAGLRATGCEWAFLTSCDAPLLRSSYVERLFDLAGSHDAVVPRIDGHWMVTAALYSKRCLPAAEVLLEQGQLRPRALLEVVDARIVGQDALREVDPEGRSFVNCNTPDEYREALRLAGLG